MVVRFVKTFALISAWLQPLGVFGAPAVTRRYRANPDADLPNLQDADAAEQEAIKLGFAWPMMDLTTLTTNAFLPSIDEHDLSIVAFHTKAAPEWPVVRAILKTAKANFTARHPDYKIQWASVDLDKNPRLTTFSHLNLIDVMFLYPDLALFPIRTRGNFSVSGLLNETEYMWQYSVPGLKHWNDVDQLVSEFVLASFKGKGDAQKAADALALQYRRTEAYVDVMGKMADDVSYLASNTNNIKRELKGWRTRTDDPQDFLDLKEELFMFEEFVQYAFKKDEFSNKKESRTALAREKNRQPLVVEKPAPPVVEEELM